MAEKKRTLEWTFGERLAKARRDAHLTQEEIAQLINVSPATINHWETGRSQPTRKGMNVWKLITLWADITNVDPSCLNPVGEKLPNLDMPGNHPSHRRSDHHQQAKGNRRVHEVAA